jgi:hypothetical protein
VGQRLNLVGPTTQRYKMNETTVEKIVELQIKLAQAYALARKAYDSAKSPDDLKSAARNQQEAYGVFKKSLPSAIL